VILNTGNRTDIPAFYKEWFYQRIKEGYVLVRNPYQPNQVSRYTINPDIIDVICFCTKNPAPMIPELDAIQKYKQLWYVTITPYEKEIEPFVPKKQIVMDSFCHLAERVGRNSTIWRYDPIFLSEKYTLEYHIDIFEKMSEKLSGYTNKCVISFIDLYEKTKRNFGNVKEVTRPEQVKLAVELKRIADKYKLKLYACAEKEWLGDYGIDISGCMTKEVMEASLDIQLDIPKSKQRMSRESCSCLLGNDIGAYNTCMHGCLYCYANYDRSSVLQNQKLHDPKSPFLIGTQRPEDIIKQSKQESYIQNQIKLPFVTYDF